MIYLYDRIRAFCATVFSAVFGTTEPRRRPYPLITEAIAANVGDEEKALYTFAAKYPRVGPCLVTSLRLSTSNTPIG